MRILAFVVGGALLGLLGALLVSLIFLGGVRQEDTILYLLIGAIAGAFSGLSEWRRTR
jgi:H+/Cl- antiporter ClcA